MSGHWSASFGMPSPSRSGLGHPSVSAPGIVGQRSPLSGTWSPSTSESDGSGTVPGGIGGGGGGGSWAAARGAPINRRAATSAGATRDIGPSSSHFRKATSPFGQVGGNDDQARGRGEGLERPPAPALDVHEARALGHRDELGGGVDADGPGPRLALSVALDERLGGLRDARHGVEGALLEQHPP